MPPPITLEVDQMHRREVRLMWDAEDPALNGTRSWDLHFADDPAGPYSLLMRVPNYPDAGVAGGSMCGSFFSADTWAHRPRKIRRTIQKTEDPPATHREGFDGDLTYHLKLQRVGSTGAPIALDAVLADLVPRTVQSYEDVLHNPGYRLLAPPIGSFHRRVAVTVPPQANFADLASVFVYDVVGRHGVPCADLRFRAGDAGVRMKVNNRNNLPIAICAEAGVAASGTAGYALDDYGAAECFTAAPCGSNWDELSERTAKVSVYRLLFENCAGFPIDVEHGYYYHNCR